MNGQNIHRYLAHKWVRLECISPSLKKALHGFSGDNVMGYGYIDHEMGMTLEIVKIYEDKGDKILFLTAPIDEGTRVITRLDGIVRSKKISILSDEEITAYELTVPDHIKEYYDRPDLEAFRNEEDLDEFRGEGYIDDVQILLLPDSNHKPELVWGRVEKYQNGAIEYRLLNKPHANIGVQKDDVLKASFGMFNDTRYLVSPIKLDPSLKNEISQNKPWWKFW